MNTLIYSKVLVSLVLLSISVPLAFADDDGHHHDGNDSNRHHGSDSNGNRNHSSDQWNHNNGHRDNDYRHSDSSWNNNRNYNYAVSNGHSNARNNNNYWKWEEHNWNEQREQLRANWRRYNERMTALQQQQLDNEMRAQWLRYHNNSWNGQYGWNQYSDPQFLDYLHSRNPSLLTRIRYAFGF